MTSDVYDQLLCIFQDNVESDGTLTADGFSQIYSDVGAQLEATAAGFVQRIVDLIGYVGLSNAGASGSATGDCTACATWCYRFDFTIDEQGFNNLGGQAVYTPGVGWQTINFTGGPSYRYFAVGRTVAMDLISLSLEFSYSAGVLDATGDNTLLVANDGFAAPTLLIIPIPGVPTSPEIWSGAESLTGINILMLSGAQFGAGHDPGGQVTLTGLTLHGTGTNPFGSDNC